MEYLPSWWLLREEVVKVAQSLDSSVDDEVMEKVWARHEAMVAE